MTITLVVLDGFGIGEDPARNALMAARMPVWGRLTHEWPTARLQASGEAVGLPAGQMGNSEVGHLNLGAGFRVLQDLPRINEAIQDGSFRETPALVAACRAALERGGRLHLMGLIGPGGIHAFDEHILAMVELAASEALPPDRVLLHAFTDGRDTPPRSADGYLPELLAGIDGRATLATVGGRYYAMDRDGRWDRTRLAYDAIVHGVGELAEDGEAAIAAAYGRGENDEFILPTVIGAYAGMGNEDVVVHLNFRADRARQLTQALALAAFDAFDRGPRPRDLLAVTLTEYQSPMELPVAVAFGPVVIDSLAAHLARLGKRQLHVAETEKYAHVTYFFNGGVEPPFPGEDRVLVPSNREVPTYDLAPEMRAVPITDAIVAGMGSEDYDFIVANYANPDMVGHTGVWDAAVSAAETIDACLGRVAQAVADRRGTLVITADHGNIEEMRDAEGNPQTKHTTSPVPIVVVGESVRGRRLRDGALSDVAPTLCELLSIPVGPEMTGRSLLV
ncbi:MAG: 2,3-bisphosphoglycerate-independent phosphoglycerate mutase [Chloroflexota bacterium]|nr:2,3-bisphosphoglycerate-independent phosphoglycerate mutase [Chloroflexota bacterium]